VRVGHDAGTWVQVGRLKASGERNWGRVGDAVTLIDSARRAGQPPFGATYDILPADGGEPSAIHVVMSQADVRLAL
jgi:hypothetical protein